MNDRTESLGVELPMGSLAKGTIEGSKLEKYIVQIFGCLETITDF